MDRPSDKWLAIALRTALLGLFLYMVRGILMPIALGGLFAMLLYPLEIRISRRLGKRAGWTPLILTLAAIGFVVLPSVLLALRTATAIDAFMKRDWSGATEQVRAFIDQKLTVYGRSLHMDDEKLRGSAEDLAGQLGTGLAGVAASLVRSTPGYLIDLFLFLLALYYFLRDGKRLSRWLARLSPFDEPDTIELFESIRETVNGAILGLIVTAGVQGALTMIALYVFEVPGAFLFGVMATLLALFIPMLGTTPVTVGAVIYLIAAGRPGAAVGMGIAALVIGISDNVVRPWVQTSSTHMHPLLVMLGIFGGLELWGASGIFVGPVVAAMAVWTIDTYAHLHMKRQQRSIFPGARQSGDVSSMPPPLRESSSQPPSEPPDDRRSDSSSEPPSSRLR
jgi:predicted PurR-regulated permease PerM